MTEETKSDTNRLVVAKLMLDEALHQRDDQWKSVEDYRQRSIAVFTVISGAVLLVAGLTADAGSLPQWSLAASGVFMVVMVAGALGVHAPRPGFRLSPNLHDVDAMQFRDADPEHLVRRDLALYHERNIRWNRALRSAQERRQQEDGDGSDEELLPRFGPVTWIQVLFIVELVAAAGVVSSVLAGLVIN
jgi:hypothetical protein